jgi:hypothetical protein
MPALADEHGAVEGSRRFDVHHVVADVFAGPRFKDEGIKVTNVTITTTR